MNNYRITRKIGIDAGHRLAKHDSKCRNLHGHRYEIEALCISNEGSLVAEGNERGMVIDFGFLKEEMMSVIDARCDHGMILSLQDTDALKMFFDPARRDFDAWLAGIAAAIAEKGFAQTDGTIMGTKLYVIADDPTAENLAKHWFFELGARVDARTNGRVRLSLIRVWETPNCCAEYGAFNID